MKKLITILILTGISTAGLFAQTENKVTTTSLSGGIQTGGTFENTYIIGNNTGSATGTDGGSITYDLQVGFLSGASVNCQIPLNLQSIVDSDVQATISWDPSVVVEYLIRYRVAGSNIWVEANQTSNSLILTGLTSGTDYQWQVRSVCTSDGGEKSAWTQVQSFTTTGAISCIAPTNFMIDPNLPVQDDQVTISWDDMSASSYDLRYKKEGSFVWQISNVTTTSEIVTGLDPGSNYVFQIRTVCSLDGALISDWITFNVTTTGSAFCEAPTNLLVQNITDNTFDVSWDASANAQFYEFRYKPNGTSLWTTGNTTNLTETLTGLEPGTEYLFSVRSSCDPSALSVSAYSAPQIVNTTGSVNCEIPLNLSAPLVDGSSALLMWDDTGADLYTIRYRPKGTIVWNYLNPASNEMALGNLVSGITYQVQVQSLCLNSANTGSGYSNIFEFTTTGVDPCSVPTNLNITGTNDTSVDLAWDNMGADYYQIRYKPSNSYIYNTVSIVGLTTQLTGLQPGTEYAVSIRSVCSQDGSIISFYSGSIPFTTTGGINCEVPTNILISNIADNSADLSWNSVTSAILYKLRYRAVGTVDWTIIESSSNNLTLNSLNKASSYEFAIRSVCSTDNSIVSDLSLISTFETTGVLVCAPPQNLAVSNISDTGFDLNWDLFGDAVSYEIRYKADGSTVWETVSVTGASSYSVTGLNPGTGYLAAIRSDCAGDGTFYSAYSQPIETNTTGTKPCDTPTGLVASNISDSNVTISYTGGGDDNILQVKPSGVSYWGNLAITGDRGPNGSLTTTFLQSGTTYSARIVSSCASPGSSFYNIPGGTSEEITFTTTGPSPCTIVTNVQITNIGENSIDVSFDGNASADLEVWTKTVNALPYYWKRTPVPSGTTSATVTGLLPGLSYQLRVVTICVGYIDGHKGTGTFNFDTPGVVNCVPPQNLNVIKADPIAGSPYRMTVSWDAVSGAIGYQGAARYSWGPSPELSNTFPVLMVNTEYAWKVATVCSSDRSIVSDPVFSTYYYDTQAGARIAGDETITSINELERPGISIYPNPFQDQLTINYIPEDDQKIRLGIFDLNGRLITSLYNGEVKKMKPYKFIFKPEHNIPKGLYLYKLLSDKGSSKTGSIIFK